MEKRSFRSVPARLALLALAMLGAALLSLCLGAAAVSPREILSVLSGGGKGTTAASILLYVRLPRTLGCLLAGAALAVSGAVIQTVLANPLAAPNIIGVNSGAGLGVALCCAVLPTAAAAVPFAAFLGAFAGVMLVLLISEKAGASRMTLVLAGVAISGMFGAGIDAVLTVFPDSLIGYSDFRIGGLANLSMGKVAPAAWVILLCLGAALALANEMDVLALGADTARSLGLRVRGVRVALLALAAALAGAAVSFAGLLGFVGLVAPHMVRRLVGGESRRLLAGCVTVLLGPNGCGKSTLLKTALGLLPALSGEVLYDGAPLSGMPPEQVARRAAYMAQSRNVPSIEARRMVLHGRFPYLSFPRRYRKSDYAAVRRAMEKADALELADRPMQELSGGQRQKVYLAMALAQETPAVFMDEPTTFLDVRHQMDVMRTARGLADGGKAVVLVSHDLCQALRTADRVALLADGRLCMAGTPEQVYAGGALDRVFGVRVRRVPVDGGWQYFCE